MKVGHAGTLDPLASGVLVVCVGAATAIECVQRMPKTYRGDPPRAPGGRSMPTATSKFAGSFPLGRGRRGRRGRTGWPVAPAAP
ncbi:MAG: hypothetical protein U0794_16530 [Isosphaeraceae bacterium]